MSASLVPGRGPDWSRRRFLRTAGVFGGLAALAPALAACGDSATGSALAADAKADPRGVTLKVLVNQPHVTAFTTILADEWAKATGGKIEVTAAPYDQLTSKQILDVQGGSGEFDVFDYFYFGLGALVDAGALVDLTDWIGGQADIGTGDFLPSIYDPYTLYNGRRYGLPYDGDLHILFYNKEIFDRHGLNPPSTWDEYDEAARKITTDAKGEYYGTIVQGQQVPMILGCSYINRLAGFGGTLLDSAGKPTLTTDAAIAAAQHLVDVAPYALPTPLQTGFDQANTAFLSGQGAMLDTWTDMSLRAGDPSMSKIAGKWGVVSLPVGGANKTPRTALDAGFGIGVSTASKHQAEAAAFVKFATSAAQNLKQASTAGSGIDPNRKSVLHSADYAKATPVAAGVIRQNLDGSPLVWPKTPSSPKILQTLVDQLALAIQGKQTAKAALEQAQQSWEQELAK